MYSGYNTRCVVCRIFPHSVCCCVTSPMMSESACQGHSNKVPDCVWPHLTLITCLKTLSPNIVTVWVRASTHIFWENTLQPQTLCPRDTPNSCPSHMQNAFPPPKVLTHSSINSKCKVSSEYHQVWVGRDMIPREAKFLSSQEPATLLKHITKWSPIYISCKLQ